MNLWETRARQLVDLATRDMPDHQEAYDFFEERGVSEDLVDYHSVGFVEDASSQSLESWGIHNAPIHRTSVNVPRGILVPIFKEWHIVALCSITGGEKPFGSIYGGERGEWDSLEWVLSYLKIPRPIVENDFSTAEIIQSEENWELMKKKVVSDYAVASGVALAVKGLSHYWIG